MRRQSDKVLFNIIGYLIIGTFAILCILPFWLLITGSFMTQKEITLQGYRLWPSLWSGEAYQLLFKTASNLMQAYGVTICVTAIGTTLGLFLTAMTAYVLNCKDFKFRNYFAFYFYFTTLFSGGLVPWYILMVKYLHMKNSYLALIVPLLLNVFHIIIMRTFISAIPGEIRESATIDGAGDFTIFFRLTLPLLKPALATIGLFIALGYWNDWFNTMLFIDKSSMYNLQYYLYQTLSKMEFLNYAASNAGITITDIPSDAYKMAITIVTTGPIVLLYPFVQRYFVKGITLGAVKG
ncbi:carbohydrate ABC transporter permease [Gorillibacterium massiliense]|uniref:carbohydrate ABC transporter permease n=1 Tax=Gorillibacterium massiliense TaxID=1280390 RepID=UPI0004B45A93|nr:carbohydrate ABC transporter permease [Gorillibacterium massiliense]